QVDEAHLDPSLSLRDALPISRNDRDAPGTSDWALVGPRFRGLDLERPFVDVVVGTPAPRTLEDLHDLADRAARRFAVFAPRHARSEEHTSELPSRENLVCRRL